MSERALYSPRIIRVTAYLTRITAAFFCMLCLVSCSKNKASLQKPPQTIPPVALEKPLPAEPVLPPPSVPRQETPESVPPPSPELSPLAIIKSGANPLWFELETENPETAGPFLINAPAEAALSPFVPWTLARYIAGMVMQEDKLIMGLNREGFLMALPRNDESIALYRITDASYWGNYTIGSVFAFEGNPAALLYRDDFFADPAGLPPSPKVFAQISGNPKPVGITIPAFEAFPSSAGWDMDTLRQGPNGYWYYRGIQRYDVQAHHKTVYFRTSDLSFPGEPIVLSDFRNSALPASLHTAPSLLRSVMDKVFRLSSPNQTPIAAVISPEFPYTRYFSDESSLSDTGKQLVELSGYYLRTRDGAAQALIIFPDGQGMTGKASADGKTIVKPITLPPLPEGFVYTQIGLTGHTLIAAWEEQQDMSVGAAGLMIIRTALN